MYPEEAVHQNRDGIQFIETHDTHCQNHIIMVFLLHDYRQYHWELGEVLLELANNNTRVLLGIATTTTLHLPSSFCFHCNRHHHLHLYNHRDFFLFSKLLKPFNVSVSAVLPFLKCVFLIYVFPSERGFELLTNLRFKVVLSFVSILQTWQICHAALRR